MTSILIRKVHPSIKRLGELKVLLDDFFEVDFQVDITTDLVEMKP